MKRYVTLENNQPLDIAPIHPAQPTCSLVLETDEAEFMGDNRDDPTPFSIQGAFHAGTT